jgi:predicted ribosomally synthesized peptide with nif11-like leader
MSTQAATRFLEKLASDEKLRVELLAQGKDRKQRIEAFVASGRKHGFEFGENDALSVLKIAKGVEEGELDERELVAVAGGGMSTFQYVVGTIWAWMGGGGGVDDSSTDSAMGMRG